MSPFRHFVSCLTLAVGLANLTFWSLPLLVLLLISLIVPSSRPRLQAPLAGIYRAAVRVNDSWFRHVLGYRWQPPDFPIDPERSYLVIANHQSWADSLLLQMVIVHKGPILKVLVKDELARWPILGLIFATYDFPRLKRRAAQPKDEPERRRQDAERIREACAVLKRSPAAMLIYPEGTRFTTAKQQASAAATDYAHLLAPRPGGFATVLEATAGIVETVLDVTIHYPDSARFWAFLSGGIREPEASVTVHDVAGITDPGCWLRERWQEKDNWLRQRGGDATAQHETD
jgi:1-acyl-sn-glycerol-3-phosphate acyltransferase